MIVLFLTSLLYILIATVFVILTYFVRKSIKVSREMLLTLLMC